MIYQCLLVDDERPALKLLYAYINKLPQLNVAASCESALSAIAKLQTEKIDILFLDIQMSDLTGLQLLQTMEIKPKVILTTAYREYAVEGFALDVIDYLIKPFSFERFVQSVNKAIAAQQPPILSAQSDEKFPEEFFVRTNNKLERIPVVDICYIESMREYICIHANTRRFMIHQTMKAVEAKLPADKFMRVHRSFLINMGRIDSIIGNQVQIGEKKIAIGGSYRKVFFERISML